MEEKRGKLLEILNSKLVIIILIFIMFFLATILAGDVIMKEGSMEIEENLNSSGVLYVNSTSGYVGIGTASPSQELHVEGNVNITGNVTASYFKGDGSELTGIAGGIWTNVSGVATYDGNVTVSGGIKTNNTFLKTRVIEIGDWNMDSTIGKNVNHGLTAGNIRDVSIMIKNDDDDRWKPLNIASHNFMTGDLFLAAWGSFYISSTEIKMFRNKDEGFGSFDTVAYDSTSYNRGWITITYEV